MSLQFLLQRDLMRGLHRFGFMRIRALVYFIVLASRAATLNDAIALIAENDCTGALHRLPQHSELRREWDLALAHYRAFWDRQLGELLEARLQEPPACLLLPGGDWRQMRLIREDACAPSALGHVH